MSDPTVQTWHVGLMYFEITSRRQQKVLKKAQKLGPILGPNFGPPIPAACFRMATEITFCTWPVST